jgi:hypothetical protein
MTPDQITAWAAAGESETLELKRTTSQGPQSEMGSPRVPGCPLARFWRDSGAVWRDSRSGALK